MRPRTLLITALVLTSVLASAVMAPVAATEPRRAAGGTTGDTAAFVGTSVRFHTASNAIVNYTVDGDTLLRNVTVQSRSKARSQGGIGLDVSLDAVTDIAGAAITLQAKASTHATYTTESGARIQANDNDRGTLVVRASGTSQYVSAELSSEARAESVSDDRVVVTREDGTQGAFIVVGEGNVTVDANGNVVTSLDRQSTLVYRQYDGNRSESERTQERLIANGTAVAEIYVQPAPNDGGDQQDDGGDQQDGGDGQQADRVVANVVNYSRDTTVRVIHTGRNRVNMTVERSTDAGKVVITTLSKEAFESTEDVRVTVDGEAAARAATYSDVVAATRGGATSKFIVRSSTSTRASVDVVVGITSFSARNVAIASAEDATPTPTEGDATATPTTGNGATEPTGTAPGFGVATALGALTALGAGFYLRRRR